MKSKGGPSINHFYEKLLKLTSMMKTNSGRKIAQGRSVFLSVSNTELDITNTELHEQTNTLTVDLLADTNTWRRS
jgi:hypothetical protein